MSLRSASCAARTISKNNTYSARATKTRKDARTGRNTLVENYWPEDFTPHEQIRRERKTAISEIAVSQGTETPERSKRKHGKTRMKSRAERGRTLQVTTAGMQKKAAAAARMSSEADSSDCPDGTGAKKTSRPWVGRKREAAAPVQVSYEDESDWRPIDDDDF